ncbi:MarR family winged helix-turn-helix transcriptional regulator [Acaricomes phytoseiuli]|uniref:MarR family winged helix-turn-helix transcriptional regulator n=1 Tax=Acaricomes phytoseiuli TaxID=291968 RepID=UPI00037A797C|nr:MarR family transcriptional regulator [Acaricomes phytoseiuli]
MTNPLRGRQKSRPARGQSQRSKNLETAPSQLGDPVDHAAVEAAEAQLSLLWRRARAVSQQLAQSVHPDLESAAYGLLVLLDREGPLRLTDLAGSIGVGKPSLSRQISVLESIELVTKTIDPADRRAQLIILSAKGRRQIRKVQAARKKVLDARLEAWPAADVQEFARLLTVFNDSFVPPKAEGP